MPAERVRPDSSREASVSTAFDRLAGAGGGDLRLDRVAVALR